MEVPVTSEVCFYISAHSGKLSRVVVILIFFFKVTWSRIPSSAVSNVKKKIKVLDVPGHNLRKCALTRWAIGQGFPVCLFVILHIELQRIPGEDRRLSGPGVRRIRRTDRFCCSSGTEVTP